MEEMSINFYYGVYYEMYYGVLTGEYDTIDGVYDDEYDDEYDAVYDAVCGDAYHLDLFRTRSASVFSSNDVMNPNDRKMLELFF